MTATWWLLFFFVLISHGYGQVLETPQNSTCQGVLMHYQVQAVSKVAPFVGGAQQPYKFQASLTLNNMGFREVKNWEAFIGFQYNEWLVDAPGTVLADGKQLPTPVGNGTILAGFPQTDLENAVETAGDSTKTTVVVNITGTEFGVATFPLPANISLPVPGYTCGTMTKIGRDQLQLCCSENKTAVNLTSSQEPFNRPEQGDITIDYSVIQTYTGNYWAEVTISNDNPLGRIDGWNLTWTWKQGEFIQALKGAQILEQDQTDCLNGPAGQYYKDVDFSNVASCKAAPTISDLPIEKTNDTNVGMIPFCCRSGLLLPKMMNPLKARSAFRVQVFKIPPFLDRDLLAPPADFSIGSKYACGQPKLIAPVESPDPSNTNRMLSAVKSWQVTCNLTSIVPSTKKGPIGAITTPGATGCCVSFSGFYNSSAIPCPTCSCGCPKTNPTCNPNAQAMLVPPYALLTAAQNRSRITKEWAKINRRPIPTQLPCPDTCGININWHVVSDFQKGWTARISILNWADQVPYWFAAVELDKAMPGFKQMFTFNGSVIPELNNTLFMEGLPQFSDFLVGGDKVKNTASSYQAVITFDKSRTPGLNVTGGDGYPTRVVFNGEECSMPLTIPLSAGNMRHQVPSLLSILLAAAFTALWLL